MYRYLAKSYKWSFQTIADMTPYQQAVAVGNILEDDDWDVVRTFESHDEALEALGDLLSGRP